MRLTTFTDYTIRVLIYIGLRPGELTTVGKLAELYGISRNHLTKVVHYLGRQGHIETLRGKGGGFRLACRPEALSLGELVRGTEKNTILVECFNPDGCDCKIMPACHLTEILAEAQSAFYRVLGKYTLKDLLRKEAGLKSLLQVNSYPASFVCKSDDSSGRP